MNTRDLGNTLPTLFAELIDGAPKTEAYMLNGGDLGLLRSLDKLSAIAASAPTANGSSASWRKTRVSAVQWKQLREDLATEAHRWLESLKKPRELDQSELNTVVGSVAHLAYHVGAIRQIDLSARGPSAHD